MTISEMELRQRAEIYIAALQKTGIEAAIVPGSARDYLLKVSIHCDGRNCGLVSLHHKPSKNAFKLTTAEIRDPTIIDKLQNCWETRLSLPLETPAPADVSGYVVYVDGSATNGHIGYGAVILHDGVLIQEISGAVDDLMLQGANQVAGELTATIKALEWCRGENVAELSVYYDYKGIECWATGEWKANQPLTQDYATFVKAYQTQTKITWCKVASHTGDRWNDRADELAKRGSRSQIPLAIANTASSVGSSSRIIESVASKNTNPFAEDHILYVVEDRYQRLIAYRNYQVDFAPLSDAIYQVFITLGYDTSELTMVRQDFDSLERLYQELKESIPHA